MSERHKKQRYIRKQIPRGRREKSEAFTARRPGSSTLLRGRKTSGREGFILVLGGGWRQSRESGMNVGSVLSGFSFSIYRFNLVHKPGLINKRGLRM